MKNEQKDRLKNFKELGYYSSLGFSVSLAIFIGLFFGLWIDKKFGTNPIFTLVGLGMGIVAGMRNLIRAMNKSKKL
jgi:ATP synthase protein I